MINFGEWLPDQADIDNPGATVAKNVLPHASGYLPMPSLEVYSDALTAYCRGALFARDISGNVYIFGGTETTLESITNAQWTDVTRTSGGAYATGSKERWEFIQWGNTVIGTNFNDDIQAITLGTANFAALSGSPPKARHISVVRNFVVLGNLNDGANKPTTVRWSALGDSTDWTASAVTQSDSQELRGTGGPIQRIFGGEFGIIFQETSISRMQYVGTPIVFEFDEIHPGIGLLAPGGAAQFGDDIYILTDKGFMVLKGGAQIEQIGAQRVDDFVLSDIDSGNLHRVSCTVDPKSHRAFWSYPGSGNTSGLANKVVIYDIATSRWSYAEIDLELLFPAATSGYTVETLDNVSTNLDTLFPSLDDSAWTGGRAQLTAINSDSKISFFTGSPMAAVIETAEFQITPGRRSLLKEVRPIVDGGATTVQIGSRDTQASSTSWLSAKTTNSNGRTKHRVNARYHRVRVNLSGSFTHAIGIEIDAHPLGTR